MELHQDVELLIIASGDLSVPYEGSIGLYGSRFFKEIREHRRFLGIRCPSCSKVRVPLRRICGPGIFDKTLEELKKEKVIHLRRRPRVLPVDECVKR